MTRLSFLLRQGEPANQVSILLPTDDAWAGFSPGKVSVTDAMKTLVPADLVAAILSAGYNVDFTDADAIRSAGIRHQILVLPPTDRIPPQTLDEIASFEAHGGRVIAVGRIPSLSPEGRPLKIPAVCEQADRPASCHPMFDPTHGSFVQDVSHLGAALHEAAPPDFHLIDADAATRSQIGFIRRRLPFADIYYVVNTSNRPIQATANFATTYPFAEQWDPDSTTTLPASAKAQPIHLAPYESRVFVFSKESAGPTDRASVDAPSRARKPEQRLAAALRLHRSDVQRSDADGLDSVACYAPLLRRGRLPAGSYRCGSSQTQAHPSASRRRKAAARHAELYSHGRDGKPQCNAQPARHAYWSGHACLLRPTYSRSCDRCDQW